MLQYSKFNYLFMSKLAVYSLFYFGVISCGKQNNGSSVQQDDISNTTAIAYSGGWGGSTVTLSISSEIITENQNYSTYASILPQLQFAVDTWNAAIGKTVLVLNTTAQTYLSQTGNTFASCSGITDRLYYPLCIAGVNGIFYDKILPASLSTSGWSYNTGKSSSILATTIWNSNGNILTVADLRFNRDSYIFGDSTVDSNIVENGTAKTLVDLRSVMIHELGHVLGLGHAVYETNSVMYPTMNIGPDSSNVNYVSTTKTIFRTLSTCDINRIKHIYASDSLLSKTICQSN